MYYVSTGMQHVLFTEIYVVASVSEEGFGLTTSTPPSSGCFKVSTNQTSPTHPQQVKRIPLMISSCGIY